jgi:predicted O-linked N-acetylglucosamine transferase (SPINDLY family)
MSSESSRFQQQAQKYWLQGDYFGAANLYEKAIEAEPETKSLYWELGLMLLLQGQEAEAQTTWLLAMAEGEEEEVDRATVELLDLLQGEAQRQENLAQYSLAWAIRQHIREINPYDINNLLNLIGLSILLKTYTGEELTSLGLIELLQLEEPTAEVNFDLLMQVLNGVLEYAPFQSSSLELVSASVAHISQPSVFLPIIVVASLKISNSSPQIAAELLEIGRRLESQFDLSERLTLLHLLASFYQNSRRYDRGIELAKLCLSLSEQLIDIVYANYKMLRGLMGAVGYWDEVCSVIELHKSQLQSLIAQHPLSLDQSEVRGLLTTTYFFPYFEDRAQQNRELQNQVAQLCQANIEVYGKTQVERYRQGHLFRQKTATPKTRLKIGYLSHCLGRHSVGWLARWLFHYHDRDRFEINAYFVGYRKKAIEDPLEDWYMQNADKAYKGTFSTWEMADEIYNDEVDLLIDLDSITLDLTPEILALKPAPVQVTWLGLDASGIPAIDYFIADPYVLPESAEDYYSEKIWRLPQTYIAVDGFEVEIPTLRRENLEIPTDAIIYLSSQVGYKRHPETTRWQMKILAQVPNSYFLLKGGSGEDSHKNFFIKLAESEGIKSDRLRFLPQDLTEGIHRAHLSIADVVLDTYPYNGATTTLETLWVGIPLVTLVGEQFAARNSYTMMKNVGVTEGIAWTGEEYIEWGVRFGKDEALRKDVAWKLRKSRQTSPLWNGKQFTSEMENAYEQMWQKYLNSNS